MGRQAFVVAGGVLGLALALPLAAAEPQMHKGTVISASAGRLVLKDMAGKEQSFTVDAMTRITVHGKPGKLEDLQETMPVQVATEATGKVLTIATIDRDKRKVQRPVPAAARELREFDPAPVISRRGEASSRSFARDCSGLIIC